MKDFLKFLISKAFLKQLAYIIIFLILVLFIVLTWLRFYTNHGQKLELPDYVNQNYLEATEDAKSRTFEIIVTDSIHKVGKEGGLIIDQNPLPGSMVKEQRKIYVNITKYSPDKIQVKDLPILYGNDFDQKRTELKYLDISSKIKDERYDPGEPNHILEVWYDNRLIIDNKTIETNVEINKGGTLEFVISKREGGKGPVPNLVCQEYSAAETMALLSKFQIGQINESGEITDRNTAFVINQSPEADGETELPFNTEISVTIVQNRPTDCQ